MTDFTELQRKFLDRLPANRKEDYDFYKTKSKDEHNGSVKTNVNNKKIKEDLKNKEEDDEEEEILKIKREPKLDLSDIDDKKDDENSIYESVDGDNSDNSSQVSIKIDMTKDITTFINKQVKIRFEK